MKMLFIALTLGIILSTNVHAKKSEITAVWQGGDVTLQSCDGLGCTFACDSAFMASYHAHRDNALSLQLLIGDEDPLTLDGWVLTDDSNGTKIWQSGCFCIPLGDDFSMVWVLESTKTGRIVDAEEALSGTCQP